MGAEGAKDLSMDHPINVFWFNLWVPIVLFAEVCYDGWAVASIEDFALKLVCNSANGKIELGSVAGEEQHFGKLSSVVARHKCLC